MKFQKQLKEKTYQNYIQQYPSYKDFFQDVIEKDKILHKIWYYTYLPEEKIDLRNELKKKIQDRDYNYLQQKVIREEDKALIDLFDDYDMVGQADSVFLKLILPRIKDHPVDISQKIKRGRELLKRGEQKTYYKGDKKFLKRRYTDIFPYSV